MNPAPTNQTLSKAKCLNAPGWGQPGELPIRLHIQDRLGRENEHHPAREQAGPACQGVARPQRACLLWAPEWAVGCAPKTGKGQWGGTSGGTTAHTRLSPHGRCAWLPSQRDLALKVPVFCQVLCSFRERDQHVPPRGTQGTWYPEKLQKTQQVS